MSKRRLSNFLGAVDLSDEYLRRRKEMFCEAEGSEIKMGEREIKAYRNIENFLLNPESYFDEDDAWAAEFVEKADWNNDSFKRRLTHAMAALEASIAYYVTVSVICPEDISSIGDEMNEIDECLRTLIDYSYELDLLIELEMKENDGSQESLILDGKNDDYVSEQINRYYLDIQGIKDELAELYEKRANTD